MFFLCTNARGVGMFEYLVAGAALPVPPPAIARSTQRPGGPFFGCAFASLVGARIVVGELAAG